MGSILNKINIGKLITLLIIAGLAFGCTSGDTSIRNIEDEPLDLTETLIGEWSNVSIDVEIKTVNNTDSTQLLKMICQQESGLLKTLGTLQLSS